MTQSLSRYRHLEILSAALSAQQYRFARQAALNWLSTFPADLTASLYYGRALLGEKRLPQAIAVFQGIRRADPEFADAVESLVLADSQTGGEASTSARTHYQALTGQKSDHQILASWGGKLWLARQALDLGNLDLAGEMIDECLREPENVPLVGIIHLRYLAASLLVDVQIRREIALNYHQRWPDCIACMLWLAQWSMEIGEEDYAVALLHQAVSRDISGQVVERLWGAEHPYRALWPTGLELSLALPIPAEVTVKLGWNRLLPGEMAIEPDQTTHELVVDGSPTIPVEEPTVHLEQVGEKLPATAASFSDDLEDNLELELAAALASMQAPGLEWALAEADDQSTSFTASTAAQKIGIIGANEAQSAAQPPAMLITGGAQVTATVPVAVCRHATPSSDGGNNNGSKAQTPKDTELGSIGNEFDRLARRLKLPAVGPQDGRYPVYVVFSVRSRLEAVYGGRIADLLVSEMQALAQTVDRRKGWSARLFMPDDSALLSPLGLSPLRTIDPWELKLALVDLDKAFSRRGERIGAVLIVGGPEIVPFHHLPNPVDDQDQDVPTDNPYATRDENYFIPEWPVGRLPGGAGNDARVILGTLSHIRAAHEAQQRRHSWKQRVVGWLRRMFSHLRLTNSRNAAEADKGVQRPSPEYRLGGRVKAFGYTAAIWKHAASMVFRPIGKPALLSVSPPFGIYGTDAGASSMAETDAAGKIPALSGRLAYFNLHGLVDAPEWYGQRDPLSGGSDPDYPVALRPVDIPCNGKPASVEIPQVIFSEACYGLHIQDREAQQAMSLGFLQAGTLAIVGSTCMAYGSIGSPLVAADLLGHTFWRFLHEGFAAGEALRQAKIHLASLMSQRQGYLDGEDQKTLISFVLYGDPLVQPVASNRTPKSVRYQANPLTDVHTVCERTVATEMAAPMPAEVIASVRRVVARHLPGMLDARLTLVHPRASCSGEGHSCPTSQLDHSGRLVEPRPVSVEKNRSSQRGKRRSLGYKSKCASEASHSLVTLSKKVELPNGVHPRVARLTLDERGKLVKLVVSR